MVCAVSVPCCTVFKEAAFSKIRKQRNRVLNRRLVRGMQDPNKQQVFPEVRSSCYNQIKTSSFA